MWRGGGSGGRGAVSQQRGGVYGVDDDDDVDVAVAGGATAVTKSVDDATALFGDMMKDRLVLADYADNVPVDVLCHYLVHPVCVTQSLVLRGANVDDASVRRILTTLTSNATIRSLDLSYVNLTDALCEHLASCLAKNVSVARLVCSACSIRSVGATHLFGMVARNRTLTELVLRGNMIASDAIAPIARALQVNGALRKLDLALNSIDSGLESIGRALELNRCLEVLNVTDNKCARRDLTDFIASLRINMALKAVLVSVEDRKSNGAQWSFVDRTLQMRGGGVGTDEGEMVGADDDGLAAPAPAGAVGALRTSTSSLRRSTDAGPASRSLAPPADGTSNVVSRVVPLKLAEAGAVGYHATAGGLGSPASGGRARTPTIRGVAARRTPRRDLRADDADASSSSGSIIMAAGNGDSEATRVVGGVRSAARTWAADHPSQQQQQQQQRTQPAQPQARDRSAPASRGVNGAGSPADGGAGRERERVERLRDMHARGGRQATVDAPSLTRLLERHRTVMQPSSRVLVEGALAENSLAPPFDAGGIDVGGARALGGGARGLGARSYDASSGPASTVVSRQAARNHGFGVESSSPIRGMYGDAGDGTFAESSNMWNGTSPDAPHQHQQQQHQQRAHPLARSSNDNDIVLHADARSDSPEDDGGALSDSTHDADLPAQGSPRDQQAQHQRVASNDFRAMLGARRPTSAAGSSSHGGGAVRDISPTVGQVDSLAPAAAPAVSSTPVAELHAADAHPVSTAGSTTASVRVSTSSLGRAKQTQNGPSLAPERRSQSSSSLRQLQAHVDELARLQDTVVRQGRTIEALETLVADTNASLVDVMSQNAEMRMALSESKSRVDQQGIELEVLKARLEQQETHARRSNATVTALVAEVGRLRDVVASGQLPAADRGSRTSQPSSRRSSVIDPSPQSAIAAVAVAAAATATTAAAGPQKQQQDGESAPGPGSRSAPATRSTSASSRRQQGAALAGRPKPSSSSSSLNSAGGGGGAVDGASGSSAVELSANSSTGKGAPAASGSPGAPARLRMGSTQLSLEQQFLRLQRQLQQSMNVSSSTATAGGGASELDATQDSTGTVQRLPRRQALPARGSDPDDQAAVFQEPSDSASAHANDEALGLVEWGGGQSAAHQLVL